MFYLKKDVNLVFVSALVPFDVQKLEHAFVFLLFLFSFLFVFARGKFAGENEAFLRSG